MTDLFDSFKVFLYERVSNPLLSAFVFSWVIINYKFFMIMFSGDDVAVKFLLISDYFDMKTFLFGIEQRWVNGFFIPFSLSVFYVFLFPMISQFVIWFHYRYAAILKNIKNVQLGETLITNKKSSEVMSLSESYENKIKNISDEAEQQLKIATNRYEEAERSNISYQSDLAKLKEEFQKYKSETDVIKKNNSFYESKVKELNYTNENLSERIRGLNYELSEVKDLAVENTIIDIDKTIDLLGAVQSSSSYQMVLPEDSRNHLAKLLEKLKKFRKNK